MMGEEVGFAVEEWCCWCVYGAGFLAFAICGVESLWDAEGCAKALVGGRRLGRAE